MNILDLDINKSKRVLAVSDIHGEGNFLKQHLEELNFDINNDYLVVVGDYIEKGTKNFKTIHYLMDLCKASENVHVVMGNNDICIPYSMGNTFGLFDGTKEELVTWYHKYIGRNTLFKEIAEIEAVDVYDYDIMHELMHDKYKYIVEWIESRPLAIRTEDFIFVHAGLNENGVVEESSILELISNDFFARDFVNKTGKTIIVGHFPTAIYNDNLDYNIVYGDNNVISIDGGLVQNISGGLNILEITFNDDKPIYNDYHFFKGERKTVTRDYVKEQQEEIIKIVYPYLGFKIIEDQGNFLKVVQIETSKEMILHKDVFMSLEGDIIYSYPYINKQVNLRKGQVVGFIKEIGDKSLIKVGTRVYEVPNSVLE